MDNYNQRDKKFNEIIIDGFKLFINNFIRIFPIFLIFLSIGIIIKVFSLTEINYQLIIIQDQLGENLVNAEFILLYFGAIFLEFLIMNLFIILAISLVSLYLYKRYTNQEANYTKDLKKTINKNLVFILLLLGIGVPFSMFLIIPGLLIYGYYIFSIFTFNIPEIKKPLSKAKEISEGYKRRIIIIFLIGLLIIFSGNIINNLFLGDTYRSLIISRNYGELIIHFFICNLIGIILSPLIICLLTPLFSSCYNSYKADIENKKSSSAEETLKRKKK